MASPSTSPHLRTVSNDDETQPAGQSRTHRSHGKVLGWSAAFLMIASSAGAYVGRVTAPVSPAQAQTNPAVAAVVISKAFADGEKLQQDADKSLLDAKDQVIAANQGTIKAKNDEITRDADQIKTLTANNQALASRKCVVRRTKAWGGLTSDMNATCG